MVNGWLDDEMTPAVQLKQRYANHQQLIKLDQAYPASRYVWS
jgi:hypothetical protein